MQKLRQQLRAKRRALSRSAQQQHAEQLTDCVLKHLDLTVSAKKIALYLSFDAEISPLPLINALAQLGHSIYLPVLVADKIKFALNNEHRYPNRFGIAEPHYKTLIAADKMDVVFTPLVAFDNQANRLGMGGGFYDKSFAFKVNKQQVHPKLYGLAFDFQRVDCLATNTWDVPLDAVFTPENHYERSLA